MVAKTEVVVSSKLDTVKLVFALAILVLGVVGFYMYESESLLYRVLGMVFAAGVALAIASTTQMGQAIIGFAHEARLEVRKVVWPTRQETVQTTIMVIVTVIIIGIILWIIDMLLANAIQLLTSAGA